MFDTPVIMIVFRRPQHTERVLGAIREVRPRKLLVIADGPNDKRPGEAERCAAARAVVDRMVDWPCQLLKNYSDVNMGIENRFCSGFNWAFEQCEQAIVLEDDELPHPSFFRYCHDVLNKYRDDERVMVVNGTNFQFGRYRAPHSYYFSHYFHCWGFATWRRAWKLYDPKISLWPDLRETPWLLDVCAGNEAEAAYHAAIFDKLHGGQIDTWDYQISFALWANRGLAVTPSVNLVSNIGYGKSELHSTDVDSPFAAMPTAEIDDPLLHPPTVLRDLEADRHEFEINIAPVLDRDRYNRLLSTRLKNKARNALRRLAPWVGNRAAL